MLGLERICPEGHLSRKILGRVYVCVRVRAKLLQSCLTLCNPMDCNPQGFSVQGIFQVSILEWVAMSSSGNRPNPGIETASPATPSLQADSLSLSHLGSPLGCAEGVNPVEKLFCSFQVYIFLKNQPQVTMRAS